MSPGGARTLIQDSMRSAGLCCFCVGVAWKAWLSPRAGGVRVSESTLPHSRPYGFASVIILATVFQTVWAKMDWCRDREVDWWWMVERLRGVRYLSPRLLAACVQTSRDVLRRKAQRHQSSSADTEPQKQQRRSSPPNGSPVISKFEPNAKPQLSSEERESSKGRRGVQTQHQKKNSTLHEDARVERKRDTTYLPTYLPPKKQIPPPQQRRTANHSLTSPHPSTSSPASSPAKHPPSPRGVSSLSPPQRSPYQYKTPAAAAVVRGADTTPSPDAALLHAPLRGRRGLLSGVAGRDRGGGVIGWGGEDRKAGGGSGWEWMDGGRVWFGCLNGGGREGDGLWGGR